MREENPAEIVADNRIKLGAIIIRIVNVFRRQEITLIEYNTISASLLRICTPIELTASGASLLLLLLARGWPMK